MRAVSMRTYSEEVGIEVFLFGSPPKELGWKVVLCQLMEPLKRVLVYRLKMMGSRAIGRMESGSVVSGVLARQVTGVKLVVAGHGALVVSMVL